MALFRWPGDPPGKPASHTKTYDQHVNDEKLKAKGVPAIGTGPGVRISAPGGGTVGISEWDFGYGKGVLSPPAPAAPAPAAPTPPPAPEPKREFSPDSIYNTGIGQNKTNFDNTISNIGVDESKTKYDFGFDDPTNPFSRALEQKKHFLVTGMARSNQMAARGQLFSGANAKQQSDLGREQEKQTAALKAAYADAIEALKRRRTTAGTDKEAADLQVLRDAMIRQGVS